LHNFVFCISLDTADPRLTDGKEKYRPKDGNSGDLAKASFDFKKDKAGNSLVDIVIIEENGRPRDKGPPVDKDLAREKGPPKKKSLPRGQDLPNDKSKPRDQGPAFKKSMTRDQNPPKPPAPVVPKVVPPPAALTPHVHKEKGCEVCSKIEEARTKLADGDLLRKCSLKSYHACC
jgi:hypothetical protein